MSASSPTGQQKYWLDGVPVSGIYVDRANTGSQKYWLDGVPSSWLFPLIGHDPSRMFLVLDREFFDFGIDPI